MRCCVKFILFAVSLFSVLIPFANFSFEKQQKKSEKQDAVYIGIAWTGYDSFIDGAELAVSEANKAGGVLDDKKIQLVINTDESEAVAMLEKSSSMLAGDSIKEPSRKVARYFSNCSPKIAAVIGHGYSFMAVSAASLYQQKKIVFITPTATDDILTKMGFAYVFRMIPKNSTQGYQLGKYSAAKKNKRAVVFYERTDYAFELGQAFRQSAARNGIDIVLQFPFLQIENEFPDLPKDIAEFKKIHTERPVDVVFIFTGGLLAKKIVREFYKRNVDDVQFITGDSANDQVFWDEIKSLQSESDKAVQASAPSLYNRNNADPLVQDFKSKFTENYDKKPDVIAALGYDSINIILNAIKHAGNSDPDDIANEIRYMSPCKGVTGKIAFEENGDPADKSYMMKNVAGNEFEYRDLNDNILKNFDTETANLPECGSIFRVFKKNI